MANDIKYAVETLNERRGTYEQAQTYYRGSEKEVFASAHYGRLINNNNSLKYVLNYSKTVVDTVLDRLEIASVAGTDDSSNSALNKIWEQNELTLDSNEIHRNSLVFGECYAIVWPDESGDVQITYNSPITTFMVYDEENPRVKAYAVKVWVTRNAFDQPVTKLNVYYADRVEKYSKPGETIDFNPVQWSLTETIDNPFGEVPVFHFRTHRPYGTPEHAAAIGAQDAINKIVMNHMVTVDYQGAPQRWAVANGGNSSEIQDFEEGDTARENLGALQNGPGELWYLEGVSQVGQFAAADHKTFTESIIAYVKSMASLTQTPLHYFQNNGQFASGEALRTAEAPLVKKIRDRQISFGSTWRDVFRFALKIEGIITDVQVKWQGIESIDSKDAWEIANTKKEVGVPLLNILLDMGYDLEVAQEIVANAPVEINEGE